MTDEPTTPKKRHRPALILLVVVAALACLALAWWQWDRYESASGTAQNLGYALQWPAFAVAVIYAYRRFVVLESDPEEARKASPTARGAHEIPAGILPERPTTPSASSLAMHDVDDDSALAEYNRALADMNRAELNRVGTDRPQPTATPKDIHQ